MAGTTPARRAASPRGGKAANRNTIPGRAEPPDGNGHQPATPGQIAAMEAETGVGQPPELAAAALTAARRQGEERAMSEAQAASEGLTPLNSVEFMGDRFRIADKVGLMPLMKFAAAADSQLDTSDMAGLSAVYSMLKDAIASGVPPCGECEACLPVRYAIRDARGAESYEDIDLAAEGTPVPGCPHYREGDWARFEQHAIATKAGAEEMLPVVQQAITILTARPTQRPAGLLQSVAGNFGHLDGLQLMNTGAGLEGLTPRQVCNLAYARLFDIKSRGGQEELDEWLEELAMPMDPWAQADQIWSKYNM